MSSDETVFTKRYGETEFFEACDALLTDPERAAEYFDNTEDDSFPYSGPADPFAETPCANGDDPLCCKPKKANNECAKKNRPHWRALRAKDAESFIEAAKAFSKRYSVSADVKMNGSQTEAWLYFSAEIISGERKNALAELIAMCDELMIIPRPRGMPKWCEFAAVLTYYVRRADIERLREAFKKHPGYLREKYNGKAEEKKEETK